MSYIHICNSYMVLDSSMQFDLNIGVFHEYLHINNRQYTIAILPQHSDMFILSPSPNLQRFTSKCFNKAVNYLIEQSYCTYTTKVV